jgi:hypothetical protein
VCSISIGTQNHAIPLSLIRDAYEGIILAAFFYLLLEYLAPSPAEQKEYFRTYKLNKWAWPFGWVKRKPVSHGLLSSSEQSLTILIGRIVFSATHQMGNPSILLGATPYHIREHAPRWK